MGVRILQNRTELHINTGQNNKKKKKPQTANRKPQ